MPDIDNLEQLLAQGNDTALLRFALGSAFIRHGKYPQAAQHLAVAVKLDPEYSAAWKLYARSLAESGRPDAAITAYHRGIAAAEKKGDVQAAREMRVFVSRLQRPPDKDK